MGPCIDESETVRRGKRESCKDKITIRERVLWDRKSIEVYGRENAGLVYRWVATEKKREELKKFRNKNEHVERILTPGDKLVRAQV